MAARAGGVACFVNERIRQLLELANGRRRVRILTLSDVQLLLSTIERRPGSFRVDSGGAVPGIYNYHSVTTVCLAVRRTDGRITLAIGTTGARQGYLPRPDWLVSEVPAIAVHQRVRILAWADNAVDRMETDGGVLIWQKNLEHV